MKNSLLTNTEIIILGIVGMSMSFYSLGITGTLVLLKTYALVSAIISWVEVLSGLRNIDQSPSPIFTLSTKRIQEKRCERLKNSSPFITCKSMVYRMLEELGGAPPIPYHSFKEIQLRKRLKRIFRRGAVVGNNSSESGGLIYHREPQKQLHTRHSYFRAPQEWLPRSEAEKAVPKRRASARASEVRRRSRALQG